MIYFPLIEHHNLNIKQSWIYFKIDHQIRLFTNAKHTQNFDQLFHTKDRGPPIIMG